MLLSDKVKLLAGAFFIFILIPSCFSGSVASGELNKNAYRYYLGKVTSFGFQEIAQRILLKHGYVIDQYDNRATYLAIDTHWKIRPLTTTEVKNKFHESKTQLLLTATIDRGATSKFTADLFSCYMDVRNLCFNGQNWVDFYRSPEFKADMDLIANDIKDEILLTMRQF